MGTAWKAIRCIDCTDSGPSIQSGKLAEKDGRGAFTNCNDMQQQQNLYILLAGLKASSSSRDLEAGKRIHADAIESGDDLNIYVASTLVNLYAKCGSMGDARQVFDKMQRHNLVSWTALMLGYAKNGEGEVALELFAHMRCAPDARTFVAALKACTSLAAGKQFDGELVKMWSLGKGMAVHAQAAKSGCDSDIFVANTLVDMHANCGSMVDAHGVFDRMACYDVVSWNALMMGYAENEEGEVAMQLFAHMRFEGCAPNRVTYLAALKACTSVATKAQGEQLDGKLVKMGSLENGIAIHCQAAKSGCDSDIFVANTLVDTYAKMWEHGRCLGCFDEMQHRDMVSWNVLMLGYAENTEGEMALQLFARMQFEGCASDALTFVGALKACTSLAATEDGEQVDGTLSKWGPWRRAWLSTVKL